MKSSLKPAIENLDQALERLEQAVERRLQVVPQSPEPSVRNNQDVSRKIAAKLDQTINRLEMLLSEE